MLSFGLFGLKGLGPSVRFCEPLRRCDVRLFSRIGSELAFSGAICGECYLDSVVVHYNVKSFGRLLSIVEVSVSCDACQHMMGNEFARIWRVAGIPCRGPRLSACCASQLRVPDHVPAVPRG